jgi:hypothetical protein
MYYAVLCICLISVWSLSEFFARPKRFFVEVKSVTIFIFPFAVVSGAVSYAYLKSPHYDQDIHFIYHMSASLKNLFLPPRGFFREILDSFGKQLPSTPGEVTGHMGLGVFFAICFFIYQWGIRYFEPIMARKKFIFAMVLCFAISQGGVKWAPLAYLAWPPFLYVVCRWFIAVKDSARNKNSFSTLLLLSACFFVTAFGIGMGPHRPYMGVTVQPSIWGLLGALIPGVGDLRAVGRITTVAQQPLMLALLLGFIYYLKVWGQSHHKSSCLKTAAAILCLIQFGDMAGVRSYSSTINPLDLTATSADSMFWRQLDEPIVVFPATPPYRSAQDMVYFASFQNMKLMNGYSAFSADFWDKMMLLAEAVESEPSPNQVEYAESLGAKWLAVLKGSPSQGASLVLDSLPEWNLEFENRNYRVYRHFKGKKIQAAGYETRSD